MNLPAKLLSPLQEAARLLRRRGLGLAGSRHATRALGLALDAAPAAPALLIEAGRRVRTGAWREGPHGRRCALCREAAHAPGCALDPLLDQLESTREELASWLGISRGPETITLGRLRARVHPRPLRTVSFEGKVPSALPAVLNAAQVPTGLRSLRTAVVLGRRAGMQGVSASRTIGAESDREAGEVWRQLTGLEPEEDQYVLTTSYEADAWPGVPRYALLELLDRMDAPWVDPAAVP